MKMDGASGREITISGSIRKLPADQWNSCLKPGCLFLAPEYLAVLEQSGLPGLGFYYAIVSENGKALAALHFQMVNLSDAGLGGILNLEEYGGLAGNISSRINELLFSPGKGRNSHLLVCGSLLVSGDYGISAATSEGLVAGAEAVGQIKKHIAASLPAMDRLVAFMVKDFYQEDDVLTGPVLRKDYFRLNTDPEMIFDIHPEWKSFDDYLDALSSKYRVRTNNAMEKFRAIDIKPLDTREVMKYQGELHRLNDMVIRKAPVKLVRPNGTYFSGMKVHFGENYIVNALFYGEQMVGFTSGLWNKFHFEAHYIGIDYHFNKEFSVYQNILYQYIRDAIAKRSERLFFGRTALEIKSTVGARPHTLNCYFRFANRMLNTLAKPFVSSAGPREWIPRDPFKQVQREA